MPLGAGFVWSSFFAVFTSTLIPGFVASAFGASPFFASPVGTRRTVWCMRRSVRWSQPRHLSYLSTGTIDMSKATLRVTTTVSLALPLAKVIFALPNSPPFSSPPGGSSANA